MSRMCVDAVGNITSITGAEGETFYQYDSLQRLSRAQGDFGEVEYKYDAVGNRLARTTRDSFAKNVVSESYQYDGNSNRLLSVASAGKERTLGYDSRGNIIDDSGQLAAAQSNKSLIYGASNRLEQVHGEDYTAEYVYNAKGQRAIRTMNWYDGKSETTHFHYDDNDQLIAETRADGTPVQEYLYLKGHRLAMVNIEAATHQQQLLYIANDHLGTPKKVFDAEGELVWSNERMPFGDKALSAVEGGEFDVSIQFPGQYEDGETGYVYNYFRDYDPSLGRYIQSDPIGLAGGVNTFAYVEGNPIGRLDYYGLDWAWGSFLGGNVATPAGGVVLGANGQFFSDGSSNTFTVGGIAWGAELAGGAEYNLAYRSTPGGTESWEGVFSNLSVSTPILSLNVFWDDAKGGWVGLAAGPGTGWGGSYQITEYTPWRDNSGIGSSSDSSSFFNDSTQKNSQFCPVQR